MKCQKILKYTNLNFVYDLNSISQFHQIFSALHLFFLMTIPENLSSESSPRLSSSLSLLSSSEHDDPSTLVRLVSKSTSARLLGKYFDASEFDFNYEQSSIWSPLVVPDNIFFTSPPKLSSQKGTFKKSSHWFKNCINSCFHLW